MEEDVLSPSSLQQPDIPVGSVATSGLVRGIMQPLHPTRPCGRREHGVRVSSLSATVSREKGKAVPWDLVITQGMQQSTSLQSATGPLTMEGPHCSCLLLLCLFPPLGIPGPLPPLEEPWELPLTPSSTADPSAHLRGRPSAPVRPYSLSLSPEDYRYSPKPRQLRPGRLRRLLGSAFDPFWMATEEPRGRNSSILEENLESMSRDLAESAGRYRRKLWREVEGLELPTLLPPALGLPPELPRALARRLRQWLVEQAACRLTSAWVDLGPVFWPRWVRHTACETGPPGCSWPPGMTCRPTQLTHIKLLAWHCWVPQHSGSPNCTWRQIPYPVVSACKCSCR